MTLPLIPRTLLATGVTCVVTACTAGATHPDTSESADRALASSFHGTARPPRVDAALPHRLGAPNGPSGDPPPGTTLVTGQSGSTSASNAQSESIVNVSTDPTLVGGQVITVAFNDFYGASTNNSYLGYAYSTDHGETWTYAGTLAPFDPSYPYLRGDPDIGSSARAPTAVYMANLALGANVVDDTASGLCVFRSTDGGQTFTGLKCVGTGAEYDGGSLAVGNDGTVYAASVDMTHGRIDVWSINPTTGAATLLATPFSTGNLGSHPRLRFNADTGTLYVMTPSSDLILMNAMSLPGGAWGEEVPVGTGYDGRDIEFASGSVRRASQYTFDITETGTASVCTADLVCVLPDGQVIYPTVFDPPTWCSSRHGHLSTRQRCVPYDDSGTAVRVAYTAATSSGKVYVKGVTCSSTLSGCHDIPAWSTAATPGDQFEPVIRAYHTGSAYPIVELSYLSREADVSGSSFQVMASRLAYVDPSKTTAAALSPAAGTTSAACPFSNYIGDYNDMQALPPTTAAGAPGFLRTFTSSPADCSGEQHVGDAVFH
jgi:hypothetical protein